MTTTTAADVSTERLAVRALDAFMKAESAYQARQKTERDAERDQAIDWIRKQFSTELGVDVVPVPAQSNTPGMEPDWLSGDPGPWESPYLVQIDGLDFIAFAGVESLWVLNRCGICRNPWAARAQYNLESIGGALAGDHDCEEPGKEQKAAAPKSPNLRTPLPASHGGFDSENIAVIAHNLGVIATTLDRIQDAMPLAGRGV